MLIKPRRVRHSSKFSSRMRSTSRQRQEYAASVYAMAIVQTGLSMALVLAAIQAFNAVQAHGTGASLFLKLVMPVLFVAGAALTLRAAVRKVRAARALWAERKRPRRDAVSADENSET